MLSQCGITVFLWKMVNLKNQELKLHLRHFTIVGGYKRENNSQCSFL